MRIIFSRKGFDSGSGGYPSPIINGRPVSLPIPARERSATTYEAIGLGGIVEAVTRSKIKATRLCHDDPFFAEGRCVFGQTGAAQTHLEKNGVSVGDAFLFFGLFADEATGERHHRIFGYMIVEEVIALGSSPLTEMAPAVAQNHPHLIGGWNSNNTLYVGRGAECPSADEALRLSQPGGPMSIWCVPPWLAASRNLTFHRSAKRWLTGQRLQAVARGQEFVADVGKDPIAHAWLHNIIDLIAPTPAADQNATSDVLMVMLRKPRLNDPSEQRSDPFWEFGSFGSTGCHGGNLLNPRRAQELEGKRLAFAQGGENEIRLVHLTPPVAVIYHSHRCELRWDASDMPLRFEDAPILIANDGHSDVPAVLEELAGVSRTTAVGRFASRFRSRRTPVRVELARQMLNVMYEVRRSGARAASHYEEALPYPPPDIDRERRSTYEALVREA